MYKVWKYLNKPVFDWLYKGSSEGLGAPPVATGPSLIRVLTVGDGLVYCKVPYLSKQVPPHPELAERHFWKSRAYATR